ANFKVRRKHGLTLAWTKEADQGLHRLDMAGFEAKCRSRIAECTEGRPNVRGRRIFRASTCWGASVCSRKLCECHDCRTTATLAHNFPGSSRDVLTRKGNKFTSTESVTLDRFEGGCYIIGANR